MIKILLIALALSLGVSAMRQDQEQWEQQSKPRKPWKKNKREKVTTSKNLGGYERRVRHHEKREYETKDKRYINVNTEYYRSGVDCIEDIPIEKNAPCEQQGEDQWQKQVGQNDSQQKSFFKSEVSKKQRPVRTQEKICRKVLEEVKTDVENQNTILYITEWDSSSEEEIKGDECQNQIGGKSVKVEDKAPIVVDCPKPVTDKALKVEKIQRQNK